MKNHSLSSLLIVGSLALAAVAPAFANDALDIFKRMDANNDGRITATEHSQFAHTAFQASDADRDGRVSLAECIAVQDTSNGVKLDRQATEAQMGLLDTDGDGHLSQAENNAYAKDEFQRADQNGDGALSLAEVQAAHNTAKRG
jgi:Ca2+-binding EF-hand superfamily protein